MLEPFCLKDSANRKLADRIKDLNQCVTLYPDIPKDKAFGAHYTPVREGKCQTPICENHVSGTHLLIFPTKCINTIVYILVVNNGYVKPELKLIVPPPQYN